MSKLFKSVIETCAKQYQGAVAKRCAAAGVKYHDLLVESDDVLKAINRIDPEERVARERRIKRAFDLSAKRKDLPLENQEKKPLDLYLLDEQRTAEFDREERALFNNY